MIVAQTTGLGIPEFLSLVNATCDHGSGESSLPRVSNGGSHMVRLDILLLARLQKLVLSLFVLLFFIFFSLSLSLSALSASLSLSLLLYMLSLFLSLYMLPLVGEFFLIFARRKPSVRNFSARKSRAREAFRKGLYQVCGRLEFLHSFCR